jgi:anaerobic selenocysteine-containing dehydrogenase
MGRHKSRVKGYAEVRGELPVSTLADEIETPGDGQVRALFTVAGNPVLSTPDGARLERALRSLDCVVSVDPYRNETTRLAHVILPAPSPLARSQYELAFYGLSVRNVARWSPPVFETEAPNEAEILARLALIASGQGAKADTSFVHQVVEHTILQRAIDANPDLADEAAHDLSSRLEATEPIDRCVEAFVRGGAYGDLFGKKPDGLSWSILRDRPHGIDLGPLEPRVPEVLQTPSGTILLAPEHVEAQVRALAESLDRAEEGLVLVGRRDLRSNNSWMHNVSVLVRGRDRCTLQVHPDDAERLGLRAGDRARIASRVGEVEAPVEITDSILRGVVSLPHGWGHDAPNARLGVAATRPGVSSNRLTDPERIDPLSGNAVLNGIPVTISGTSH